MTQSRIPVIIQDCPEGYIVDTDHAYYTCIARPVYIDGDSIKAAIDIKTVFFSFAIATVGFWTALIVIEQSVSAIAKRKSPRKWTLISALSFSISGIWCSEVIGLTGLSIGSIGYQFNITYVIGALVVSVCCCWMGFTLILTDPDFAATNKNEDIVYQQRGSNNSGSVLSTTRISTSVFHDSADSKPVQAFGVQSNIPGAFNKMPKITNDAGIRSTTTSEATPSVRDAEDEHECDDGHSIASRSGSVQENTVIPIKRRTRYGCNEKQHSSKETTLVILKKKLCNVR